MAQVTESSIHELEQRDMCGDGIKEVRNKRRG